MKFTLMYVLLGTIIILSGCGYSDTNISNNNSEESNSVVTITSQNYNENGNDKIEIDTNELSQYPNLNPDLIKQELAQISSWDEFDQWLDTFHYILILNFEESDGTRIDFNEEEWRSRKFIKVEFIEFEEQFMPTLAITLE